MNQVAIFQRTSIEFTLNLRKTVAISPFCFERVRSGLISTPINFGIREIKSSAAPHRLTSDPFVARRFISDIMLIVLIFLLGTLSPVEILFDMLFYFLPFTF